MQRYSFVLSVGSAVPVEAEYRNVKVMRLTVYPPDGRVRVVAPSGTAPDVVKKFAASKIKWIEKHRAKFLNDQADKKQADKSTGQPAESGSLRNNSTVYVWGVPHKLELVQRSGYSKIVVAEGRLTMYIRPLCPKAKKEEVLDRWYRRALQDAAALSIKKWESIIGVQVKKLYVRKMKTHWGSCNYQRQTLRLNSELAKRDPKYLEYVVVHEMLHIIEKGHNRIFYDMLDRYIPDWKAIRKKMNAGVIL